MALTYDAYAEFFGTERRTLCRKAFVRVREWQDNKQRVYELRQILEDCLILGVCPTCGKDLRWHKTGKSFGVVGAGAFQGYTAKCCRKTYTTSRRV